MRWTLLCWFSAALWAQNPTTLSLTEAVELGLRPGRRADTALAGEALARAQSQSKGESALLKPLVETRISGGERTTNLAAQGIGSGQGTGIPFSLNPAFTTFDARPSVSMTLLNLAQWKTIRAARREVQRSAQERDWTADTAAHAIATQYLACLQAQAEVAAAQSDLHLSEDLLHAAEQRLKAGTVTVVDVTRARSQAAADRNALIAQRQTELEARANLFRAIGVDYDDQITLTPLPAQPFVEPTIEEAVAAASNHRADLRMREQAIEVASEKHRAVRAERYPTLSGSFDIGRNGLNPADTRWTRTSQLNLNLTVFDSGRRAEREAQASIVIRENQIRLDDLKREIRRQIRVALGKLDAAHAQIEASRAESDLANAQLAQMRERSIAGLSTGLDVSDAQTRLARSARSHLKAEYALKTAQLELWNATGQLREHILSTPGETHP